MPTATRTRRALLVACLAAATGGCGSGAPRGGQPEPTAPGTRPAERATPPAGESTATGAVRARGPLPPVPACETERFVFDPPGERHSLPQLAFDGQSYAVVGYDGPPTHLFLTTVDLDEGVTRSTELGPGGVATMANDGPRLGIAFLDPDPAAPAPPRPHPRSRRPQQRGPVEREGNPLPLETPPPAPAVRNQSYFTIVDRDGRPVLPRMALGDRTASHTAPGTAVVHDPDREEWGVVWTEVFRVRFARISPNGRVLSEMDLSPQGTVGHYAKLLWTGSSYALVTYDARDLVLLEFDGERVLRRTAIPTEQAMEPVVAHDGRGTFGVAFRSQTELTFLRISEGRVLSSRVIARSDDGRWIGSPVLGFDGARFVIVWSTVQPGTFDDRLLFARLDPEGAVADGYPVRVDPEETHQGYASMAGTGCDLAVSHILGDPNGSVRVALVRGL